MKSRVRLRRELEQAGKQLDINAHHIWIFAIERKIVARHIAL